MQGSAHDGVVVVGAGIGGLALALALGRAGHQVTVLERDVLPSDPSDPNGSGGELGGQAPATDEPLRTGDTGDGRYGSGGRSGGRSGGGSPTSGPLVHGVRRGVPQGRHTHGLLARLSLELRERFPDVLEDLRGAGATEVRLPGSRDEHTVLLARRTTLEAALLRAVLAEPAVTIRSGVAVTGLLGRARHACGPAVVEGVRLARREPRIGEPRIGTLAARSTRAGDSLAASTVVMAAGRRGDLPGWLQPLGVALDEEARDHGLVYLTRWYRLVEPGRPPFEARVFGDAGYVKYLAVPADGGLMSVSLCVRATDELRSILARPEGFDRAIRALPDPTGFLQVHLGEPDGPVHLMGGLGNRLRRFTDEAGEPVVLGLHAVGDAHTCTNPVHGRGCSVALVQAGLLADAFAAHPGAGGAPARDRAVAYEAASRREVEPWYRLSELADQPRGAWSEEERRNTASVEALFRAVVGGQVDDPVLADACARVVNMLATPDVLFADVDVLQRAMALMADADRLGALAAAPAAPSREELLAVLAA